MKYIRDDRPEVPLILILHAAISKFGADDDVTHTVSCEPKGWKREVGRVFSNFFFM